MRSNAYASLGEGWFSDCALMNGQGWLIAGFGAAGAVTLRVLTWSGTDVSSLREIYSAPIVEGFGYGRIAAVPGGDAWCAFHDGRTAHLHNLTTGAHAVLDPSSGSSPVCFGAGYFAWQGAQAQGWQVSRLKLGTASIDDHVRNGQATGLSRVDEAGNVVLVDEDRLRLSGATQPAFAGDLGVGEGADGGVLWRVTLVSVNGQAQRTGFVWPGEPTFTPRCAAEDDTVAVCTAGGPGVRLFCGTRDELYSLTGTVVVPPPVVIVPDPPVPPVDPPKPPTPPTGGPMGSGTATAPANFNPDAIVWHNCPSDIMSRPKTTDITHLDLSNADRGFNVDFSKESVWVNAKPEGWDGGIAFTLGMLQDSEGNGTWHGSLPIEFWSGLEAGGGEMINVGEKWFDGGRRPNMWGPMRQPKAGELTGMLVTAGDQRGKDVWVVKERSGIIWFYWPSAPASFDFPVPSEGNTGGTTPPATGGGNNPPVDNGGGDTGHTGGGNVPQMSDEQFERLIGVETANGVLLKSIDSRLGDIRTDIAETSTEVKKNLPALIAAMAGGGAGGLLTGLLGGKK